ncbi:HipA-like protein [Polaromonas sp. CF318]|uniref:type II toxin-antitoxin system HipA family toxin n=1 Tax=Polaromonas sp. CF318 TaxID=1144318 RepID=UPI000271450A|nr:HipA domain-containing protein [Polaromonas sp. CF318]EJL78829.1 HipA-like protein [Polaromonas sp. CF318]
MSVAPVWVWLPGQAEPVLAGELTVMPAGGRFRYVETYLGLEQPVSLDPVELRLTRRVRGIALRGADGLPGVVRDARPAGYGADRLNAQAGRELSALELLQRGVPDGVGAIEVCQDLESKLRWRPQSLESLEALLKELDQLEAPSRALRRLNGDLDTSAGGERPKATLVHEGKLWLAKMQARGDRPALPAREFVTMRLAGEAGIEPARVLLRTLGEHQVLLVERFDRAGDPVRPQRRLYASAHTVLQLQPSATRGDPARSYLNLADRLRVWMHGREDLQRQLELLWRRMVFNALVGNVDDHPLNHGLLHDGKGWALAPAFDITPALTQATKEEAPMLLMATGADGSAVASAGRLLDASVYFGLRREDAQDWLNQAARLVAGRWEGMLREAVGPVVEDAARKDALVADARAAFSYAESLARG